MESQQIELTKCAHGLTKCEPCDWDLETVEKLERGSLAITTRLVDPFTGVDRTSIQWIAVDDVTELALWHGGLEVNLLQLIRDLTAPTTTGAV